LLGGIPLEFIKGWLGVQNDRAREAVVAGQMVLREVIAQVFGSWAPVYWKLALLDLVLDPVKTYIHGFGAFLLYGFVSKTCGHRVVGLDGRRWLRMA
jgi:hypothetical protein